MIEQIKTTLLGGVFAASLAVASGYVSDAQANKVYVSNERGNTVTVIDSDTWEAIAEFPAGNRPRGIGISPDGKHLYVCASDDDTIKVFDAETYEFLWSLPSGPDPELFVINPDGTRLYISNEDDNLVTVVDTVKKTVVAEVPVGVEPEGMAVSPDVRWVINTSETTNMAHFISTEDYQIKHNILVDQRPRYAHFTNDGALLFVSSEIGGTVSVINMNGETGPELETKIGFEVSGVQNEWLQPVGMRITSDNEWLFVALGPANRVAVINIPKREVEKYILVGQRVWQLDFTPDEKYLLSTNGNSNDITVIDVAEQEAIKSIQVGQLPWGVVVAPN
ncbi:yvtn beta-propeller repeat-containing protein [Roseibium sp. TrichSKD4]|uniref:PQQ-dependent catabolism-associated beta-propeller protein n=1 Tax=Roseibium sp. TrichSKD4 TaxID=744980 RepID=UPI0001E56DAF|nr:PQQ-dependent catabolism-associated beta-propeller protein [Roseibium sp. TrichSKD4]EFO30269.1 yvtn beta-propeller repeat-containing protein [Roseibium sp. TrichSKD4]